MAETDWTQEGRHAAILLVLKTVFKHLPSEKRARLETELEQIVSAEIGELRSTMPKPFVAAWESTIEQLLN